MARAERRAAMPPLAPHLLTGHDLHRAGYQVISRALANRTVELINFDRAAAALPEAGQMFRR